MIDNRGSGKLQPGDLEALHKDAVEVSAEMKRLIAQGIVSREAIETPQAAQPEGPEPDGEADALKEDHR